MTTVSYSYSFKGSRDFQSAGVHLSITDEVREGETPMQAMARLRAFVHEQAAIDGAPQQQQISAPATVAVPKPVTGERDIFTYRQDQIDYANSLLDRARWDRGTKKLSEAWRNKLMNRFKGRFVDELADLIAEDIRDFEEVKRTGVNPFPVKSSTYGRSDRRP